jgi:hypothetical protein
MITNEEKAFNIKEYFKNIFNNLNETELKVLKKNTELITSSVEFRYENRLSDIEQDELNELNNKIKEICLDFFKIDNIYLKLSYKDNGIEINDYILKEKAYIYTILLNVYEKYLN